MNVAGPVSPIVSEGAAVMMVTGAPEDRASDDVGRGRSGTGPGGRWHRVALIGLVGAAYFAALVFALAADGGREAALFFGTSGFVVSFPILLLLGRLVAAALNKVRALGSGARLAVIVAPALLLAGMGTYEGYRAQDPVAKFERWVASPAPPGVRVLSAYTYQGINFWDWAFHFTVAPDGLPKILARRPYRHEVEPAGFDLAQVRDHGRRRPGYPVPAPDFQAVHRYRFHAPTARVGSDVTLYGDASQTEFFAFGYVE